jgi:hypothetical protein
MFVGGGRVRSGSFEQVKKVLGFGTFFSVLEGFHGPSQTCEK